MKQKASKVNYQLKEMCQNEGIDFLDYHNHPNAKKNLNNSKLHLNEKGSAKLSGLFLNYFIDSHK